MQSNKNDGSEKFCTSCGALLTSGNWRPARKRENNGLCRHCRQPYVAGRRKQIPDAACFGKRADHLRSRPGRDPHTATAAELRALYESQGGRCAFSGLPIPFSDAALDHKLPVSRGGGHDVSNLQFLHKNVNYMKHTMTMEEFTEFFDKVALARILEEGA